MTKEQRKRFKNKNDLSNMTIQDYKNWLKLYKNDFQTLTEDHIINLKKVYCL